MLSIAISSFFLLALSGAVAVIATMFSRYRDRIASVIQSELRADHAEAAAPSSAYHHRIVRTPQLPARHRSLRPVPLRAAA